MAAPSFVQASTGATDATGTFTFTGVATGTIGDIVILQIVVDGTGAISWGTLTNSNINNLAGSAGWTEIGIFFAGSATQQRIFIGRRTSAVAAPTFTASANTSGDDVYGRMYEFHDVNTGTLITDVIENVTAGSTTTSGATAAASVTDAAVTTLGPDRLALNFVGINDDNAISNFTGETGGDWQLAVAAYADSGGTDAALGLEAALLGARLVTQESGTAATNENIGPAANDHRLAQSFQISTTRPVESVEIQLATDSGAPADGLIADIQTDSAGSPSGSSLGSVTLASPTASAWNKFTFSSPVTLDGATTYWLVISRTGADDAVNYRQCIGTAASSYAGGQEKIYDSGAGTWGNGAVADINFRIHGTNSASTIDGGAFTQADGTDTWSVVGFALIGTTPTPPSSRFPRNPAVNFQDPAYA